MSLTAIELNRGLSASTLFLDVDKPDRWSDVDHFRPSEFAGHLDELAAAVIIALDLYRKLVGFPVQISPATWGNHSSRSYHYRLSGRNEFVWAIDVFPECDLLYAWMIAVRCSFWGGIGCYPFWEWKNKKLRGGLHLDIRRQDPYRAIWWRDRNGRMSYLHQPEEARKWISEVKEVA